MAVRRHMTNCPLAWWQREALEYGFFQPSPLAQKAIRAHFRSIVRTYGVGPMTNRDIVEQALSHIDYDGHSLRI